MSQTPFKELLDAATLVNSINVASDWNGKLQNTLVKHGAVKGAQFPNELLLECLIQLEGILEYWSGRDETAVDAIKTVESRAGATLEHVRSKLEELVKND